MAIKIGAIVVFLLCTISFSSDALKLTTFDEKYGPFNETYYTLFEVEKPATISNAALQITPDSAGNFNLSHNSGRVMLKRSFKLWNGDINSSSQRVASFNTSFLINIFRVNNATPGEGLAFIVAPNIDLPPGSSGQYLGLTNSTTDGDSSNQLLAVELDTVKQDFDPDDNHIGLNINGVRSKIAKSLTPLGIELAPIGTRLYNVWVQYDGVKKIIEVYIAEQMEKDGPTPTRPNTPVIKSDLNIRGLLNQNSYFGFAASTGETSQLNCVLRWNLTVDYYAKEGGKNWLKILLGAGVPVVVMLLLAAAGIWYYMRKKKMRRFDPNILGALKSLPGTPREFPFRDLNKATKHFDETNKLGQGGYGVVYRGMLQKENLVVAVKKFSRESISGQDDFLAELTIINRLRHRHLVPLLGWCHKNGKLLIVYDYMPHGSLDKHLFGGPDSKPLSWDHRYKIVSGVASALHYLHDEFDQRVVHRDLKASNIMLDANFNARLGDFGLARALDNEKTSYAEADGVLGTLGYIAPECFHTGKATQQSDIYAFGAVILEVVCSVRPGTKIGEFQFLVDWVWFLYREGRILEAVDAKLENEYVPEEAERLLLLGLACSHPTASERPKTQTVVQILSGSVPVPEVPPFKPSFVWPSMPFDVEGLSGLTTTSITTSQSQFGSYISRESYTPYTSDNYSLA